jgi:proliferating cell nuclear antigen
MPSDAVASGIIEAGTLETFCEVHLGSVDGSPFVSEGKIHMTDDGWHTAVVDPANVGMHPEIHLSAGAFESYESPGSATVGINFSRLVDVVDIVGSADLVSWDLDMETRKLELDLGPAHQSVRLIDPDNIRREPDVSELDLPNTVTLTGAQIDTVLEVADLNSDHVNFLGDPDAETVTFDAQGDVDRGSVTYGRDDAEDIEITEATDSLFSLDYLQGMTAAIPDDARVMFRFGDEFPTKFSWATCEGNLSVRSMLAPRIQSE